MTAVQMGRVKIPLISAPIGNGRQLTARKDFGVLFSANYLRNRSRLRCTAFDWAPVSRRL
jgi:hypothetical protein